MKLAIGSFLLTFVFILTSCGGGGGISSTISQSVSAIQRSGFITGISPVLMVGE
jgi:hypothetical protein